MQSIHRAPSEPLREIVARLYLFGAELPADYELVDNLLSETAFIRILLKGDWAAQMPDGTWRSAGAALLFGPNSRPMKVRCRGSFEVIGIAIRPAGWSTLFDQPASEYTDRMLALGEVWGADCDRLTGALERRFPEGTCADSRGPGELYHRICEGWEAPDRAPTPACAPGCDPTHATPRRPGTRH